jgi:hypothetical protein
MWANRSASKSNRDRAINSGKAVRSGSDNGLTA